MKNARGLRNYETLAFKDCPDCGMLNVINPETDRHEADDGIDDATYAAFNCPALEIHGGYQCQE